MSYEVLARKWRPSNFSEMVGQEHVLRALTNALESDRLHHAYLFTGTRGVGKTTVARILAKCLNCEKGVTAQPCGQCEACKQIAEGRFIDLVEVDAASRTRVDDTRELLDNVQYTPTSGRYKIYLIDEVHMLSKHSFNALLKTLEEPPPHVKFLFATTDYDKIPPTILSRCLQFNLKRIPVDLISGHLTRILEAEKLAFDKLALHALATAADGSIRDALSLMDQAIAFGNGSVKEPEVNQMLGSIPKHKLYKVLQKLAEGDASAVLESIDELDEIAPDYDSILAEMISLFHHLAVIIEVPSSADSRFFEQSQQLSELAPKFTSEDIQLFYDIAVRARRDMPYVLNKKHGLEMALLRMLSFALGPVANKHKQVGTTPASHKIENAHRQAIKSVNNNHSEEKKPEKAVTQNKPQSVAHKKEETHVKVDHVITDWKQTIVDMKLEGMPKAFATHCELKVSEPGLVKLSISEQHDILHSPDVERIIHERLEKIHGDKIKLVIEKTGDIAQSPAVEVKRLDAEKQKKAVNDITSDPLIETLSQTFGAEIIKGSIKGT